ncbi:MAG: hypothetical protein HY402_01795 [Elusimicrobia bacterium]|nr:hypothetical protein [Elusimicrobiota bacterium]
MAMLGTLWWMATGAVLWAEIFSTTPLPQALLAHSAAVWGNRIYVAGGISDVGGLKGQGGFINNTYYSAVIGPSGHLGAWEVATALPEFVGLGLHLSAAQQGTIYVMGGTNLFGPRNTVYYASVQPDGSLGNWQSATSLPKQLMAHAGTVHGNRIYVLGGIANGVGAVDSVFWSEIQPDRSLGEWHSAPPLPAKLFGHQAVAVGSRLYLIGGTQGGSLFTGQGLPNGNVSAGVYRASILGDGSLGAWEAQSSLPLGLTLFRAQAVGSIIYSMGGFDGQRVWNGIYFASVGEDGTLGVWNELAALPQGLLALASASDGNFVYALGGGTTYIDAPQKSVYVLPLSSELLAAVDLDPDTLNLSSQGQWITATVELPGGEAPQILADSIRFTSVNGQAIAPIWAEPKPRSLGDANGNGISDWMVKFDRTAVSAAVAEGEITLRLEGSMADGRTFSGENAIHAIQKSPQAVRMHRGGIRKSPEGIEVEIPPKAFPGNPDLLLSIRRLDGQAPGQEARQRARAAKGLVAVAEAVEFGPHGARFEEPLTLSFPYDPAEIASGVREDTLAVYYWNEGGNLWEGLPSEVDTVGHRVRARATHFSLFQVMGGATPQAGSDFKLGEVYVYPNPARGGASPVLHIEVGAADRVRIQIFTLSGQLAHEASLTGAPSLLDDGQGPQEAYEYAWKEHVPSGVYLYVIEVSKSGVGPLRKTGKFAVVR